MISSTSNERIKQVAALVKKSKFRNEKKLFVVEGIKMFAELDKEKVKGVYASESFLKNSENRKLLSGCRYEEVSDDAFKAMSDTSTPQGILALAEQYNHSMKDIMGCSQTPLIMLLETISDPGNLGTIIRAGEGAGVTGIIMDKTTVDIYNPKVIRSTMGSIYRVPFIYAEDLKKTVKELKSAGVKIFAAHLNGKKDYDRADYRQAAGFMIGNEAAGLSREMSGIADELIKIPMHGSVESLNAAVAASILMYEAARQRRS